MASPLQSSDRSSSSRRSTPVRSLPDGEQRSNGYHRSHRDSYDDSPSRQLLEDFGRMLVNDDRAFKRSLDEQTAAQQKLHIEALNDALARHKAVRERAERTRERVELELERERRRREEDEKKAIEKARRDIEEQKLQEQKRQLEDAKIQEEERKKQQALKQEQDNLRQGVEAQRQREAENSRRQSEVRKQQEAEQQRKSTQEAAQRAELARQASEAEQRQQQTASQQAPVSAVQQNGTSSVTAAAPQPASTSTGALANLPQGIVSSAEERMAVHKQYLDLHKRLKHMRQQVSEEVKKVSGLKDQLSDWRRAIKKCVGQLMKGSSEEIRQKNKRVTQEIVQHLDAASRVAEPSIDVTQYLVQNHQPPGASTQGPAVLVFLLNHFAKSIVGQFALEGAFESKIADVIGVLAVTVFARQEYLFNGQSLIDLLWAKYHQRCPVLFGISGSERTQAGRARLGWGVEGGAFVQPDEHYTRMTGLGSGFAALTLRDFSKSKNSNPAPNRIFWESMARILNTPASEVQATHFVVLKAMTENFVPRIIGTFGGAGIAMLRKALIVFPNEKGPQDEKGKKLPSVTAHNESEIKSAINAAGYVPRQAGGRHGHPNANASTSGFSPLARSTMESNTNTPANLSGFASQMGSNRGPVPPSGMSHAHSRPDPRANTFNPPTAPAAMRSGAFGGPAQHPPNHNYRGPNPIGTSMMAANDIQRKLGKLSSANSTPLGDRWYMR